VVGAAVVGAAAAVVGAAVVAEAENMTILSLLS
jgi:hypothetical protein